MLAVVGLAVLLLQPQPPPHPYPPEEPWLEFKGRFLFQGVFASDVRGEASYLLENSTTIALASEPDDVPSSSSVSLSIDLGHWEAPERGILTFELGRVSFSGGMGGRSRGDRVWFESIVGVEFDLPEGGRFGVGVSPGFHWVDATMGDGTDSARDDEEFVTIGLQTEVEVPLGPGVRFGMEGRIGFAEEQGYGMLFWWSNAELRARIGMARAWIAWQPIPSFSIRVGYV
ncbi:MAG TPA: hypothetical protein VI643_00835 [Planctomycetota bacterium]|nr:hypothetical protein [Planctomycetota bacterium]